MVKRWDWNFEQILVFNFKTNDLPSEHVKVVILERQNRQPVLNRIHNDLKWKVFNKVHKIFSVTWTKSRVKIKILDRFNNKGSILGFGTYPFLHSWYRRGTCMAYPQRLKRSRGRNKNPQRFRQTFHKCWSYPLWQFTQPSRVQR